MSSKSQPFSSTRFNSMIAAAADDDDFQIPLTQTATAPKPSKKQKRSKPIYRGKENIPPNCFGSKDSTLEQTQGFKSSIFEDCSLDSIPTSFDCGTLDGGGLASSSACVDEEKENEKGLKSKGGYLCNSIESRLIKPRPDWDFGSGDGESQDFEELDVLLKLCDRAGGGESVGVNGMEEGFGIVEDENGGLVLCPLCGADISDLSDEERQVHSNECLDEEEVQAQDAPCPDEERGHQNSRQVLEWLRSLGLEKYKDAFVREEIDWDTLQWLTEEDLVSIGITALGPRKKIVHALAQLREGATTTTSSSTEAQPRKRRANGVDMPNDTSEAPVNDVSKTAANKLITDYFPGFGTARKQVCTTSREQRRVEKAVPRSGQKRGVENNNATNRKLRDIPSWCCIPGTPFRVDAFKYLRRDCSHWFLTHFHMDHYQGLTKSFCHGKIYCSSITAKLVNMKIGIPWDSIQVVPVNHKMNISGINVTCLDANHCPGSIIILFEPPDGKAVLHTGDFRYSNSAASMSFLQTCSIHTLILDTTYCNPQYDFPKQEAVIQFVIDAIQAETFNPKTLFLIGSYTIGKERLFLEVARVLRKKIYVNAGKLHTLKCLDFPEEDMQWFTLNEQESHIHVVPMWTLASFKRLKHISNQYSSRFSLIVAFSPTGWTFGKGKKKSPGRRSQQGTIIRYEVPYSEHSSFTELREFVKLVSPVEIIPSVNNHGPDSAKAMVSLLSS
ncbi:LOW QUALITY PROTEIN: DNA cross-link repair protein SNM1 [Pyrus x bretschneideri]|uniref:LOW QUALITY PROTEIN: DNA cross-link repair protein SNM1 n=1 Tax=Pyrus x bretschneideri TaxID=225117 RepID=UPI0020308E8F|nr:LOW QUALITY PROTEIN: DNA cross-link repair protein SNM1 [Pyrus x bretschneideri]